MTEIPVNAKVECADGPCGHSTDLIVNPVQRRITHFVVKDKTLPDSSDRLVPVEQVANISGSLIHLGCTRAELAEMPPFTTTQYLKAPIPTYIGTTMAPYADVLWEDPMVAYDTEWASVPEHHIPAHERAVHRGMAVKTGNQKVGQVDELVVDPDGEKITHLMMRTGHLWGKKDVAIPVSAIDSVVEEEVRLNIDKEAVGALPAVPVKRHSD
jgi:sporulation protein YlmC with PRC-barrel domain